MRKSSTKKAHPRAASGGKETELLGGKEQRTRVKSVQWLSRVRLSASPWTAAPQASLSISNSWSLLKPNHLILCHPLLLLPSIFPHIRVFSNESALRSGGQKYWSFSFSISPSNEYKGLISFKIKLFDLAVQGTLKSLLQHSTVQKYQFYGAQPFLWSNCHIHT